MDEPFDFELSLAVSVASANAAVVSSEKAAAKIIFFMMFDSFLFGTDHSMPPHTVRKQADLNPSGLPPLSYYFTPDHRGA